MLTPSRKSLTGEPLYSKEAILGELIVGQTQSANKTSGFAKDAREKAAISINEMAEMARQMGFCADTLYKATDGVRRRADETKSVVVQSCDKIKSAYDRLNTVELEKVEKYANAAERLVLALSQLDKFNQCGKLSALVAALNNEQ